MNFRYDLNGLRAIAVIAVVLFHFNPAWVPGGFAGVDVFFVISGFLMTGIIFRGLENDNFNLFKFYVARANRIIPALAVLCLVLLVFGWFYITPLDYRALGKHVASSMGFLSNVIYWRESGYFDAASHEKWLLHTWSLSVEWQFYILYPIVLVALNKFLSLENLKRLIVIGTVLGFCLSVIVTMKWPNPAYYLLPTRAWEMMMGGVAFLYPWNVSESKRKLLEISGLFLIFGSYAFVSSGVPWPGHFSLIPVLGSYLMIVSNRQSSVITNNKVFQYLGKWSYSIYLWHWPVVVLGYYFDFQNWALYGLPLSLALGFLSFNLIERYKFHTYMQWSQIVKVTPIYMVILVSLIGACGFITNGFEHHYSDAVLSASLEKNNKNPYECMTSETGDASLFHCYIGVKDNIRAIVIGDSHADALTTSISSMFDSDLEGVIALTRASCPFILHHKNRKTGMGCFDENFLRLEDVKNYQGVPIVLVGRWSAYIYGQSNPKRISKGDNRASMYFDDEKFMDENSLLVSFENALKETLCTLTDSSPVVITQPIPEMRVNVPDTVSRNMMRNLVSDVSIRDDLYFERNHKIRDIISKSAKKCGAVVADPYEYLCTDGVCKGTKDGRPIYYDGDHMSEYGNKILTPMFEKSFLNLL